MTGGERNRAYQCRQRREGLRPLRPRSRRSPPTARGNLSPTRSGDERAATALLSLGPAFQCSTPCHHFSPASASSGTSCVGTRDEPVEGRQGEQVVGGAHQHPGGVVERACEWSTGSAPLLVVGTKQVTISLSTAKPRITCPQPLVLFRASAHRRAPPNELSTRHAPAINRASPAINTVSAIGTTLCTS